MRPTGGVRQAIVAAFVMVGVVGAPARAETPVEIASAAIDELDYTTARVTVDAALAAGGNSPDDTAELYRLQGVIAGALGDAQGATDAFLRALAIRPRSTLSAGMPPKIVQPFEAARRYFSDHPPFKIKADTQPLPPTVTIVTVSDPLKLMAGARVTVVVDGGPEQTLDGTGTIKLPPGGRLDLRVSALDAQGNRLADLGSKDVPIVIVSRGARVDPKKPDPSRPRVPRGPGSARPLYLQWWAWGGAAVVFAGIGSSFGIATVVARNDLRDLGTVSGGRTFDDATQIEDRARRNAVLTNIGLSISAGFAIGATVLYLTSPERRSRERPTLSVTPVPLDGGGGLSLGGSF